jgi:hypothetical protein
MENIKLYNYLIYLGYSEQEVKNNIHTGGCVFTYSVNMFQRVFSIDYVYAPNETDIYNKHLDYWNKDSDNVFIAVGDDRTHIINAKEKPKIGKLLSNKSICIKSFEYGVNLVGYENTSIDELKKDFVDSTSFFDFVSKHARSRQEVDKDLLLNLLALKSDLMNGENEHSIHLLILRCLFVKYLEDRGIFQDGYLENILSSNNSEFLIEAFENVCKINGDVFKYDRLNPEDIRKEYLQKLSLFFSSDYRSGQGSLFPYRFDKIPIQLISHVYEAFLKGDARKNSGVYYTPSFLVDFMLRRSLCKSLLVKKDIRVLDPAVGSGIFLVESFKMIVSNYQDADFELKKQILETQLYGIDIDKKALQIAAFSLYLALLEGEDPAFIRYEMDHKHPILPSLIGKTLIEANSLTDNVLNDEQFDLIICNPPWGSVSEDENDLNAKKERTAIGNKGIYGEVADYKDVSDYERSQAFLVRLPKWGSTDTIYSVVVKNAIFLNDNALDFRKALLKKYQLNYFYELSDYNKILFKKRSIGKINGKEVTIGASEPCAVIIAGHFRSDQDLVQYVSPKLNAFSEVYECIQFSSKDVSRLPQRQFIDDDLIWKVLVNGGIEDYELIKGKLFYQSEMTIEARSGFQPKQNMKSLGEPIWRDLIEPADFERYFIKEKLSKFNWNQGLHRTRDERIFKGNKLIIPVRPLEKDELRLKGVRLNENILYKHNIVSVKLYNSRNVEVADYTPYLGLFNSQLFGYYFFQTAVQWGKGSLKRATFRNCDIEKLPVKDLSHCPELSRKVKQIEESLKSYAAKEKIESLEKEIDDLLFDLYDLYEFEKEAIREFYQVRVERASNQMVNKPDILSYIGTFCESYKFVLAKDVELNATYFISPNFGTIVRFYISDASKPITDDFNLQILNFVKNKQLSNVDASKVLNEEKVKLYGEKEFYIVKSNLFKDWTKRQAMNDAREEIELILNKMRKG